MKSFAIILMILVGANSYIGITKSCCAMMSGGKDMSCMHGTLCSKCVLNQSLQSDISLEFVPVEIAVSYNQQIQTLFEISEQPSVPPPKA